MGIYLPNIEMPKETTLISIGPGGTVEIHRNDDLTWVPLKEKAVHVPEPHGDLIDRDALPKPRVEWEDIVNAPTVIPASEEGEA